MGPQRPNRGVEAHDAGDVMRAASALALLTAPAQQRRERNTLTHDQRAHALWPADLVGAHADQIGGCRQPGDVEPWQRLYGIGVQHATASRTRFVEWLDRAN